METLAFSDLIIDKTKDGTKLPTNDYQKIGSTAIIDQGQEFIAGYTDRSEGIFTDVPVIIFGDHTRVFKYIDFPFFLGADGVKILKANREVNYRYLYYYFLQAKFPNTGYARHFKWLKELQIPLPPLAEQKHITAILDKTQKIIAEHKQMLQKYDTLIKSRFIEMFGDPHNNTKYTYKNVGDFTTVTSGGTPDRKNIEYWKNGNIPWVKTTELQNNELTNVEEFITQKGLDESSAKMMPIGTLLIAMYGQGKTRGMTAYLGIEASTNQACACILPSKVINQKFLWYYFILSYDKLRDLAKGGNQPNLNGNMIKDFPVLMPPIEMQNEYVSFVQQIDKSKFAVQKSLEKTETLYKSLMQQYFG